MKKNKKIAFIGAGSLGFCGGLTHDMFTVPELQGVTISLTDIDKENLGLVEKMLKDVVSSNKLPAKIIATTDRRKALEGADYIFNTTRIGGLEAFATDIEIPLKYGVDQCVGDTLCAGGIMYGQRGIAAMADFCQDIREVASPDALLLSYGNPNAMLTWYANTFGGVECLGLCHGVQGGHNQIAEAIAILINGNKKPDSKGYRKVTPADVDIVCAGINHQTWYVQAMFEGEDWAHRLLEGFERHPVYSKTEKVRIDVMKNFGYYSTESNGHLSEYVSWYRKRSKAETRKWIAFDSWISGETGGYLRVCREGRQGYKKIIPKLTKQFSNLDPSTRSFEHGARIIEALETGRVFRGHFNLPNWERTITNLPEDAIVEVPAYVDGNGISVPSVGDLPPGCAAVCSQSIGVQRLAVLAALDGDVELLKQAMLLDPLTSAVCTPPEISRMTDEMLVAQAKWLPQYRSAIPAAKKRLAKKA